MFVVRLTLAPGNESSRMRQYSCLTMRAWEKLRFIKRYRTPIATRAFARVYIFVHPIFWGPYYAYLVEQMLNDTEAPGPGGTAPPLYTVICANIYVCCLSVLTSLAMMGLFNVRYRLEAGPGARGPGPGAGAAHSRHGVLIVHQCGTRAHSPHSPHWPGHSFPDFLLLVYESVCGYSGMLS